MEIRFANRFKGGVRYELRTIYGEEKLSDYRLKNKIRKFLTDCICRADQIEHVRRIYQYPGFEAMLTTGTRIVFTQYTYMITPSK